MWEGGPSTGSGRTVRESPVRRGVGDAKGEETPRATPLWIPAFAGMTMWGSAGRRVLSVMEGWGSHCGGTGDSRIAPTTGCGALGDATGLAVRLRRPAPVPPSISLRANGRHHPSGLLPARERRVREALRQAQGERTPPLWVAACAGTTRAGGPLRMPSGQASTGSGRTGARPSGYLIRGGDGLHGVAEGGLTVVAYYYGVGH